MKPIGNQKRNTIMQDDSLESHVCDPKAITNVDQNPIQYCELMDAVQEKSWTSRGKYDNLKSKGDQAKQWAYCYCVLFPSDKRAHDPCKLVIYWPFRTGLGAPHWPWHRLYLTFFRFNRLRLPNPDAHCRADYGSCA